jgi:hypothetical protein
MRRKARREREVRQLQMQFLRAPSPVRVAGCAHVWRLHVYLMKFKSKKDRQFRELDRRELLGAPRAPARAPSLTTPVPRVHTSSSYVASTTLSPHHQGITSICSLVAARSSTPSCCCSCASRHSPAHNPHLPQPKYTPHNQKEGLSLPGGTPRKGIATRHRHTASPHVIHHMLVDHRERTRRGVRRSSLPCPFDMEQPPRPAPEG